MVDIKVNLDLVMLRSRLATMLFMLSNGLSSDGLDTPPSPSVMALPALIPLAVYTRLPSLAEGTDWLILLTMSTRAWFSIGKTQSAFSVNSRMARTLLYGDVTTSSSDDGYTAVTNLKRNAHGSQCSLKSHTSYKFKLHKEHNGNTITMTRQKCSYAFILLNKYTTMYAMKRDCFYISKHVTCWGYSKFLRTRYEDTPCEASYKFSAHERELILPYFYMHDIFFPSNPFSLGRECGC